MTAPRGRSFHFPTGRAACEQVRYPAACCAPGRVQIADIVPAKEPSEACRGKPELWAECLIGTTRETADHFSEESVD